MNAYADGRREAMVPAMFAQCPLDRHGARKGCGWVGEHDEEAVACVVDFLACVSVNNARSVRSCHSTRSSQAWSPIASTRLVDPQMSLKRRVATAVSAWPGR